MMTSPFFKTSPALAPLTALLCGALALASCTCGQGEPVLDGGAGGAVGGGAGGSGGSGAGAEGGFGAGVLPDGGIAPDPSDEHNTRKDSDCDGLSDAEEFGSIFVGGKRTDPANPDSDGDGILDGVELGRTSSVDMGCSAFFAGDADPASQTVPTEVDSDGDGINDGLEDANHDGRAGTLETDPTKVDSDSDGLKDGDEDVNKNGAVDPGETDPRKRDTDGDFINDGVEKSTTHTDPLKPDTDGDSCYDGAEDFNQNGIKDIGETNPNDPQDCGAAVNPDSDNDGLPNAAEQIAGTNPNDPDTDKDGLKDGIEDANKNGTRDFGETDPLKRDSDCDGLIDGPSAGGRIGEDENADGFVQLASETDPRKKDTDGDGISDGVERGITVANVADAQSCSNVPVDADPTTTTNPSNRDSDGDGIDDGAEDTNQNGRVDPGELDPKNPADGNGPAGQVCTASTLRPIVLRAENLPDLQLGLPATFTEVSPLTVSGMSRGLIGYDGTNKVAFVAWRQTAPSNTATNDELAIRAQLATVGPIGNGVTTQTFTTWDGVPAVQAFYTMTMASSVDLKVRANAVANSLVGAASGALAGSAGVVGDFQVQAEYLHRVNPTNGQKFTVVVIAMRPTSVAAEGAIFSMSDTAGGSAVAQFGDGNAVQCETFQPSNGKVDFLFVVDDSCSMASSQTALANAGTAVAAALNNSTLDWRVALVTSEYHVGAANNQAVRRGFTRNIRQFQAWLTSGSVCATGGNAGCTNLTPNNPRPACDSNLPTEPNGDNGGCWVGTDGSGDEGILGAARRAVDDLAPTMADGGVAPIGTDFVNKLRPDAQLVVVLLGDADDQTTAYGATGKCLRDTPDTCEDVNDFVQYFNGTGSSALTQNPLGRRIAVHGIVCPQGADTNAGVPGIQTCNDEDQAVTQRHGQVIAATGGVRGAINDAASITSSIRTIISSSIAAAGHRMQKPPIGASVKVAMNAVLDPNNCSANNLPRSRQNGFDFDGINRTISFFGACRPSASTTAAAVSYRYWVDVTPNQGGNPPPCSKDPYYDPNDPDFCRDHRACDLFTNTCTCPPDCGGQAPKGKVCNPNILVCNFVCTSDCGGSCSDYETCNVNACACQCVQTATCNVGYRFQNSGGVCGCVCDTAALNCGAGYLPNTQSCACVCAPNCGGCPAGKVCNQSVCACGDPLG